MKKFDLTNIARKSLKSRKYLNMLFDNIYPIIWHYYRVRINDEEEAKDLSQNACLKIVRNLKSFDYKKASFTTWMYKLIKNILIDFFRKKSLPIEDVDFNLLESTDSPLNELLMKQERESIKKAFGELGFKQKEILEMKYFFNMKNNEIALSLGIKERSVSSSICKAFEKLHVILGKMD